MPAWQEQIGGKAVSGLGVLPGGGSADGASGSGGTTASSAGAAPVSYSAIG